MLQCGLQTYGVIYFGAVSFRISGLLFSPEWGGRQMLTPTKPTYLDFHKVYHKRSDKASYRMKGNDDTKDLWRLVEQY